MRNFSCPKRSYLIAFQERTTRTGNEYILSIVVIHSRPNLPQSRFHVLRLFHSSIYYPKAALLCGRAIDTKQTLSIGHLGTEYRESPPKPYKSILAIPLFSSKENKIIGCLSIDCSRPFFFSSFSAGAAENKLENTLQPYLQLVTMTLEKFCGNDYLFS